METKQYPRESDLQGLAAQAQTMVQEDAKRFRDEGTCVLGAGIAVQAIPNGSGEAAQGCHKPRQILLTEAPFQGNLGSQRASDRALAWLKEQGIDAYWYDGRMD